MGRMDYEWGCLVRALFYVAVAVFLCAFVGCQEYTEKELIAQLYEKDAAFRRQMEVLNCVVSNRVSSFEVKQDGEYAQLIEELNQAQREMLQTLSTGNFRIRQWFRTGCLQKDQEELVPTKGELGFVPFQSGTFMGITLCEGNVVLHFRNNQSCSCKPSVLVTFYDQHLERLGAVKASWFWTSLSPNETADEVKSLPFAQRPFYFVAEHLR